MIATFPIEFVVLERAALPHSEITPNSTRKGKPLTAVIAGLKRTRQAIAGETLGLGLSVGTPRQITDQVHDHEQISERKSNCRTPMKIPPKTKETQGIICHDQSLAAHRQCHVVLLEWYKSDVLNA